MAEALLLISLSIALGRAAKSGLIGRSLRLRLAEGAEVELLREVAIEMALADPSRADGLSMMTMELEAAGGWSRLISTAPEHALEGWAATQEVLRS